MFHHCLLTFKYEFDIVWSSLLCYLICLCLLRIIMFATARRTAQAWRAASHAAFPARSAAWSSFHMVEQEMETWKRIMELYGTIWNYMELYGTIQYYFGTSGGYRESGELHAGKQTSLQICDSFLTWGTTTEPLYIVIESWRANHLNASNIWGLDSERFW